MKTQTVSTMKNKVRTLIAGVAFLALVPNLIPVAAQQNVNLGEQPLQIKHIGTSPNGPVFQLDFNNESAGVYLLSVKDEGGTVLYTEKVTAKTFSRKFKWDNEQNGRTKLIFTLSGAKTKKDQVVEVNTTVREVQDVVINRL